MLPPNNDHSENVLGKHPEMDGAPRGVPGGKPGERSTAGKPEEAAITPARSTPAPPGGLSEEQWAELAPILRECQPLTPELREWALKQFTEEELVASLRDVREHGGTSLRDLIQELEQGATGREPAEP